MASIETNMKFVKELLNSEGISQNERQIILGLVEKELIQGSLELKSKLQECTKKSALIQPIYDKKSKSRMEIIRHEPKVMVELLSKFSEDTSIKYTTHRWDSDKSGNENINREEFQEKIKIEFDNFGFARLKEIGLDEFYWTIRNFLFEPYDGNDFQKIGWGVHKIKFSWKNSDLIDYYKTNKERQPKSFPIPEACLPIKYLDSFWERRRKKKDLIIENPMVSDSIKDKEREESFIIPDDKEKVRIKIKGEFVKYFEDYIKLFKDEIEFRSNLASFFKREFGNLNMLEYKIEYEGLEGVQIFTCTSQVEEALKIIAGNIKSRPEKKKHIIIKGVHNSDEGYFELKIEDVGSFSNAALKNKKICLKNIGQIIDIRDQLISLCDFSIESKFKDKDGVINPYEIQYLSSERTEFNSMEEPYILKSLDNAIGFTYKLKFYE